MPILSDRDYQARDDAYTLARAEEIKMNEERLNNAKAAAKQMLEDEKKNLRAMAKVAGKNISVPNQNKTNTTNNTTNNRNKFNVFKRI